MSRWKAKRGANTARFPERALEAAVPAREERPALTLVVPDGEPVPARPTVAREPRDEASRAAEAFKDQLLGVLSHELRTPLHVISGLQDLLADEVLGALNPDQKSHLETIGQEVDRLGRLIGDVLDASALTAGDLPLWKEPVALGFVVEDVVALLGARAAAKGVRLLARVPERMPEVRGDEGRIAQVLARLLTNAIEFSPAGATVAVTAVVRPGYLRIEVEDAGCGIPERDQPSLFQRFRQLDMSRTREHGGLGMGLFLCRRLIEAHGGRIGLRSAMGAGSTFWFTLPRA
jgi:signal transduction histidine kinase